jgi:molybdopterin biosynthesis enzyme MoaB
MQHLGVELQKASGLGEQAVLEPGDVTPEATAVACTRMLPGFGEQMRAVSLRVVPTAILSRQTAGIRGRTLVINLPGKPSAIRECLDAVAMDHHQIGPVFMHEIGKTENRF